MVAVPGGAATLAEVAASAGVNWILIAGVVAGVIIIALLIFFLARARRGY